MAESAKHLELVGRIVTYIATNYNGAKKVATLHDLPGFIGCEKPPIVGGFRPDVYAVDAPLTTTIIGEAKTQADLETTHTRSQVVAFLNFLRTQPAPVLVVAVPWQVNARAAGLLSHLSLECGSSIVRIIIVDEVGVRQ